MKANLFLSLILAGTMTSVAHAEEAAVESTQNTTTVKVGDVQSKDEQIKDIDDEITNAKMRAESGSKSKWSVSADLGYYGGNLETPFSDVRPNYSGEAATNSITYISGDVGVSYRIDPKNRISLSTGISVNTPFQARGEDLTRMADDGGATDVSTPSITWGHSGRIGSTQNSLSIGYSHSTSNYDVNTVKTIGALSLSHVIIFDIKDSNWQPGFSTSLIGNFFKDGSQEFDHARTPGRRYDYQVGFYPFVEYAFNDRYSFRTVFRPFTYSHMRSDKGDTFERSLYTQSAGVGIAVTRDIYLYPNLQFAPENLRADLTNVGLNTTINVF